MLLAQPVPEILTLVKNKALFFQKVEEAYTLIL
jgi:hypothetical protein